MKWRKWLLGCVIFVAVERFCYFQTGTFALSKMRYEMSPPSPTSLESSVDLEQPLRFIGAGKQFYAFETADQQYVVKFMKWSRRRPLPWLESLPIPFKSWRASFQATRQHRAHFLQTSSSLALQKLQPQTQLVIPKPLSTFTLIDNLGISHCIDSSSTHFYVQRKATSFPSYFQSHLLKAKKLLQSFIHTVATQCRQGISNLDPMISRNYGIVDDQVILMDIGSFFQSPKLHHTAMIHYEITLELLPLRAWLQKHHPEHLSTFDQLLSDELHSS